MDSSDILVVRNTVSTHSQHLYQALGPLEGNGLIDSLVLSHTTSVASNVSSCRQPVPHVWGKLIGPRQDLQMQFVLGCLSLGFCYRKQESNKIGAIASRRHQFCAGTRWQRTFQCVTIH